METILKCILQDLDAYGPEISSTCVLNNLSLDDLYAAQRRVERFYSDLNRVIQINEE